MALCCSPTLLIADEPTTSLDVTIEAQILELLTDLQAETGMAIMLISHNLAVVSEMADDIAVMYLGKRLSLAPPMRFLTTRCTLTPKGYGDQSPAWTVPSKNLCRFRALFPVQGIYRRVVFLPLAVRSLCPAYAIN